MGPTKQCWLGYVSKAMIFLAAKKNLSGMIESIISCIDSWTFMVLDDLKWLTMSEQFGELPHYNLCQWRELVIRSPKKFKKYVRKYSLL